MTRPYRGELNRPLFHWSPRERRRGIERFGLRPGMRPHCSNGPLMLDDKLWVHDKDWRAPYICLGPDPWKAAVYSWMVHGEPGQTWDLWQIWLDASVDVIDWRRREDVDIIHVERIDGQLVESRHTVKRLVEVRIATRIPKSRVEWLGSRELRAVSTRSQKPR